MPSSTCIFCFVVDDTHCLREAVSVTTRCTCLQARSGDPGQGGAVSVGPIWHACIAICPAKHRLVFSRDCPSFLYTFMYLSPLYSLPMPFLPPYVSDRDGWTFVYQIIHISACISCTEVIKRSLDTYWPTQDMCFAWIAIGGPHWSVKQRSHSLAQPLYHHWHSAPTPQYPGFQQ